MQTRTKRAIIAAVSLAVVVLGLPLAVFLLGRRPPPPVKPVELKLSFKPAPASKALTQFLRGFVVAKIDVGVLSSLEEPLIYGLARAWYKDPGVKRKQFAPFQKHLDAFHRALKDGGCPDFPESKTRADDGAQLAQILEKSYRSLARMAVVEAVLLSQQGQPDRAASRLGRLLQQNQKRIQRCAQIQRLLRAWLHFQDHLVLGLAFPFSHASLSPARWREMWKILQALEAPSSQTLADVVRLRLEQQRKHHKLLYTPRKHPDLGQMAPGQLQWPWYVASHTEAWLEYSYRAQLRRALQPFSRQLLLGSARLRMLRRIRSLPKEKRGLQHNATGLAYASIGFTPLLANWHQSRCLAAAIRHQAWAALKKHKRPHSTDKYLLRRVANPLTGKPFPKDIPRGGYCAIKIPHRMYSSLGGIVYEFPPYRKPSSLRR